MTSPFACGRHCHLCPAATRCGRTPNYCRHGGCGSCAGDIEREMRERRAVMDHLGGLDLAWHGPLSHPVLPELPDHLPVLVQAYADPVDLPWVALHGGRVLGATGKAVTAKHLDRPLHEVYRLAPTTRIALHLYVEDRVLEGFWAHRREVISQLRQLDLDLVFGPNMSVWRDDSRWAQTVQSRRALVAACEMLEAGLPAIPDVGFAFFEPDGRLWADWINSQPGLQAVSLFCGGRKIHAEVRAHRETVEDVALFHQTVRSDVAFVLGGVHAPARLADYRRAAPGRKLVVVNGMAYSLAQRRRSLAASARVARSAREIFLANCRWNDEAYACVLRGAA